MSFSGGSDGKESARTRGRPGFCPSVREDPLQKGMVTHSSILAWRIPWTDKPSKLPSMGFAKSGTRLSNYHFHTGGPHTVGPHTVTRDQASALWGACAVLQMISAVPLSLFTKCAVREPEQPSWLIGSLPTPLFKLSYIRLYCDSWGRAIPSSSRCSPAGLKETNCHIVGRATWQGMVGSLQELRASVTQS